MASRNTSFSGDNQNVDDLAQWFQLNLKSIQQYKNQVLNGEIIDEQLIGMTYEEVQEHFNALFNEIEYSFCLNMIAATEALFRMDYIVRATNRLKDDLSRDFRSIYQEKAINVGLEDTILENWKNRYPELKGDISNFIGALKFRHWLAHGRYWTPKLGKKYDATSVYIICDCIVNKLPLYI